MTKVIFAIILTLITFALTKSANTRNSDATTKETTMTMSAKDQDSSVDSSSDFDMEAIMNACNESYRIEMAYLEALNESGSFIDETDKTPKPRVRVVQAAQKPPTWLNDCRLMTITGSDNFTCPPKHGGALFKYQNAVTHPGRLQLQLCFIRCMLKNMAVVSEDGRQFNPARAAIIFAGERNGQPMHDIEDMAALCANRQESCACERSYKFMRCLMSMEIERYEKTQ